MPETKPIKVQKSLFDLESFDDVTLVKVGTFEPVSDVASALQRLGGDSTKLLAAINAGLEDEAKKALRNTPDGWHTFKVDEAGEETNEVNGPFTGQVADAKKVNTLVLTLAKSVFGFSKDMTKVQKAEAKEQAKTMIKDTPAIRAGLAKTAALTGEED